MKTFINAVRVAAVTLVFVSLTALGGCCKRSCAPRATCNTRTTCNTGCKLQPEPVKIRKTCDHPGFYKQVCHLEYVPCEGKEEVHEAYPIYLGCFDEQGNQVNGGGAVSSRSNGNAYTQDVDIQVSVPSSYSR